MKRNIYIGLIAVLVFSVLAIWHSVIALASITLIVSGITCFTWDRRSRSFSIRRSALSRNVHLIAAGAMLLLLALATIGVGSMQSSTGLTGFLWVVSYTFSLTAVPVLIWHHFVKRRFHMHKAKLLSRQKCNTPSSCPAFFEQRDNVYQANSFDYKPSRSKPDSDRKQLRIAV